MLFKEEDRKFYGYLKMKHSNFSADDVKMLISKIEAGDLAFVHFLHRRKSVPFTIQKNEKMVNLSSIAASCGRLKVLKYIAECDCPTCLCCHCTAFEKIDDSTFKAAIDFDHNDCVTFLLKHKLK